MASRSGEALYNALIRTHHITSTKKIARLRKAAATHSCYVLLHSGSPPGVMYCEGSEDGVRDWVAVVHSLRYKDYQLVSRPAHIVLDTETAAAVEPISEQRGRLVIVSSVKDFGTQMQARRVLAWWRRAMGYSAM